MKVAVISSPEGCTLFPAAVFLKLYDPRYLDERTAAQTVNPWILEKEEKAEKIASSIENLTCATPTANDSKAGGSGADQEMALEKMIKHSDESHVPDFELANQLEIEEEY